MVKIITDQASIANILNRGVISQILPSQEEFITKLQSGERLKIYLGVDPTSTALHLSHAKNYLLLEEFRKLGHEVILLFGDFTAEIGDPTGRNEARPSLSPEQIAINAKDWLEQIKPILNFADPENPPRIVYNSTWLSQLSFREVLALASNFTVQQMIERDMFDERWQKNQPIYLNEFFYPLMQGYDSVALEVDVELCGTDQIFNALAGRTLLKRFKNKEKFVVAVNLMANPKTNELMSKSRGTGVFLSSPPAEMYGAIMAQPDEMIEVLYVNCTRLPLDKKEEFLAQGPRASKAEIAKNIVARLSGQAVADLAEEAFNKTFRDNGVPEDIIEVFFKPTENLAELLVEKKIIASKTEWRRLIDEGAVRNDKNEKVSDPNFQPPATLILKIGKRRFVKIIVG